MRPTNEAHARSVIRSAHAEVEESEAALVERARVGDLSAASVLIARHLPRMRAVARRMVGSAADVDDVVQEALVDAMRGLGRFQGQSSLGSWLHRVTVNAALMWLRSNRRRCNHECEFEVVDTLASDLNPEERTAMRQIIGLVSNAVEELPEKYRASMMLAICGDAEEDTESAHGVNRGTHKSRLYRARRAVRASLGDGVEPLAGAA